MSKKLLISIMTAGVLSVPLAGMAGADPAAENPGVPGNVGGVSPGSLISELAQVPDQSTPETVREVTGVVLSRLATK